MRCPVCNAAAGFPCIAKTHREAAFPPDGREDFEPKPHTIEERIAIFLANTRLPADHKGAVLLREAETELRRLRGVIEDAI